MAQTYATGVPTEGFYYIVSNKDLSYYLCPAEKPDDASEGAWYGSTTANGTPMLTTHQNVPVAYALWYLTAGTGDNANYFQLVHHSDGKYIINDQTTAVAEVAHVGTLPTDDANTWFSVTYKSGYYAIKGKAVSANVSFNPKSGNKNSYGKNNASNTGLIGYYKDDDGGSKWRLVKVVPEVAVSEGYYSISFPIAATIYYTTDGSDPTNSTTRQQYTAPFQLTGGDYKILAVAEATLDSRVSDVGSYIVTCAEPTITNTNGTITMATATAGATIRYTTDGSDPTNTSTEYTTPLVLDINTGIATIKAVSMLHDDDLSDVAVLEIAKCATPVITCNDADGTVTMTCSTEGATIRYTTNGSSPEAGSTAYSSPNVLLPEGTDITQLRGKAFLLGCRPSDVVVYNVPQCAAPIITCADGTVRISCATAGATIYYATSGAYSVYTGPFSLGNATTVTAYAAHAGYSNSATATYTQQTTVSRASDITDMSGNYLLAAGFVIDASVGTAETPFAGSIDGQFNTIVGTNVPLLAYANGATIRNVIIDRVAISSGSNVGAIAAEATGATRIYNCGVLSGTVSGSGYVGSLVGLLDGEARVVNCYSFATVEGGTDAAGIVGYNNVASTTDNLKTMVMNCMFYGNVTGAANISPIYGGLIINNNSNKGLSNFNYYSFDNFTSTVTTGKYNCALGAETRFLTRFEFYRLILNSNRELATWYVAGSTTNSREIMAKWVLDKSVAPFPILKVHGTYPSVINYDAADVSEQLGTLSVIVSESNTTGGGQTKPDGATVTTSSLTLTRTGKDPDNYNFNYDKVQLPYYNDIGTGNYTGNRVVTGWKVTAVTGGTPGTFVASDSEGGYNFADRNCTQKDLYSVTGRVLSQGAYFDVPTGVTAITIEPYWAVCTYLSDPNYDKTYKDDLSSSWNITTMGTRYSNGQYYNVNGNSQIVYTSMVDAIAALGRESGRTVYDYAVVLVGNYHHYYGNYSIDKDTKGFSIMSADLDGDNEPDNCFFYQHTQRKEVSPIRFDFLCWSGIGMAKKPSGSLRMPNIGIFRPNGWFEVTNTCLAQFYQFEYDWSTKNADAEGSPLILLGGVYEQIVSANAGEPTHTNYIHVGCNAWFKMFNNGVHADNGNFTPHKPISVTGGDYDKFYLSGMFRPNATVRADNAECYISGGRFGELAGAGMEQINGDVYWQINYADIENFYGGGINDAKPVMGNITVGISNSNVSTYCGGPKFGDMTDGKTVTTTAEGCTFGRFFGAGYGGTSYNRIRKRNFLNLTNYGFNTWATDDYSRQYESSTTMSTGGNTSNNGSATVNAIATNYEYELFPFSGFADDNNVGRLYVNYASLSLAITHNVTNTLTGCTVLENFYGGGNLGKVNGNVTSTLTDCIVKGNVYGAGFSATAPTVDVMNKEGFAVEPYYDGNSGTYTLGEFPATTTYTWTHTDNTIAAGSEFNETDHLVYTTVDMTSLGTVTGKATLTIDGSSVIGVLLGGEPKDGTGSVFGGGEESTVGSTEVRLLGHTRVYGNVYGGGDMGEVLGDTKVIINGK